MERLLDRKPTGFVDFEIMLFRAAARPPHQKKSDDLEHLFPLTDWNKPITDITDDPQNPGIQTGLFADFTKRGPLDRFAGIQMAFRKTPDRTACPRDQYNGDAGGGFSKDDPAG